MAARAAPIGLQSNNIASTWVSRISDSTVRRDKVSARREVKGGEKRDSPVKCLVAVARYEEEGEREGELGGKTAANDALEVRDDIRSANCAISDSCLPCGQGMKGKNVKD